MLLSHILFSSKDSATKLWACPKFPPLSSVCAVIDAAAPGLVSSYLGAVSRGRGRGGEERDDVLLYVLMSAQI